MLPAFAAAYAVLYPPDKTWEGKVRQRQSGGGAKAACRRWQTNCSLSSSTRKPIPCKPCMVCNLMLSQPQTHYWIHRLLPVLQRALAVLGMAPERDASRVATSALALRRP